MAKITNCVIDDNIGATAGGGVACETFGALEVRSCSFTRNGSSGGASGVGGAAYVGAGTLTIWSSILHEDAQMSGQELAVVPLAGATPTADVSWSDVQGGLGGVHIVVPGLVNWSPTNIDVDPLYDLGNTLRLRTGSPCIDASDPSYVAAPLERECPDFDELTSRLLGEQRVNTLTAPARLDMGADEYFDCNSNTVVDHSEPVVPDCNANGLIDDCEIALGLVPDADGNGVPDDCQFVGTAVLLCECPQRSVRQLRRQCRRSESQRDRRQSRCHRHNQHLRRRCGLHRARHPAGRERALFQWPRFDERIPRQRRALRGNADDTPPTDARESVRHRIVRPRPRDDRLEYRRDACHAVLVPRPGWALRRSLEPE